MEQNWVTNRLGILDDTKFIERLSYLIGAFAIFIVCGSILIYILHNWFKIEHITIKGNTRHITNEQLSYIAQNRLHGTVFTLDIKSLQREFLQIPWVQSVVVNREFPDSITVNINEYDAIARWGDEGMLSLNGRIFSGADDSTTLPTFNGHTGQIPQLINDYNELKPFLKLRNLNLLKLEVTGSGITKIFFSNNLQVVVCSLDITNRINTLNKYWDKLYQLNPDLNYVNMCYKDALAINSPKTLSINNTKPSI